MRRSPRAVTTAQLTTELQLLMSRSAQFYVVVGLDVATGRGRRSGGDTRFLVKTLSNRGELQGAYRVSDIEHTALEVLVALLWGILQRQGGDNVPPHIYQHARSTLLSPGGARFVCQNGTVRIVTD
jgi:hypothetical protein